MIYFQGFTGTTDKGLQVGFRTSNDFSCDFYFDNLDVTIAVDTSWHYWACTYNSSNRQRILYRDGIQVGSNTAAGNFSGAGGAAIGEGDPTGSPTWFFNGTIDDVRIYNRPLSATEIQDLYQAGGGVTQDASNPQVLTNGGLVGHWTFDGKYLNWATNQALDSSGQGNNGTLVNMVQKTSPVSGKIGQALQFNGTNQYVTTGTTGLPTGSNARSVFAWIYVSGSTGNEQDVFSYGNAGTNGQASNFGVQAAGLKLFFSSWGASGFTFNSNLAVTTGAWHFVGYTFTGSGTVTLYLDGAFSQSSVSGFNTVIPAPSDASVIGSGPNGQEGARYFNGRIDDVRVYNRALSASEVQTLYDLGR
jgi:hypothetical protein